MRKARLLLPPLSVWLMAVLLLLLAIREPISVADRVKQEPDRGYNRSDTLNEREYAFFFPEPTNYADGIEEARRKPLFSEERSLPKVEDETPSHVHEVEEAVVREAVVEAAEAGLMPDAPDLEFRGYLSTGYQTSVLLFVEQTMEEMWVAVGDRILDWDVVFVSKTAVRLERETHEIVVQRDR